MADRVGQRLGNYRLIQLLGVGSYAEVYLGEHIYLSMLAAIKVLHVRLATLDQDVFLREARTIASLTHPNIVRILDYGLEDKMPFLVMEYAQNNTLRHCYPKGTILPLTLVVSYIKQAATALQFAHDKKIIHRDIKPENLLLGANNEVMLSDFGTASFVQSTHLQNSGELFGTIPYMAPEQFKGKTYFVSDQYALGIVAYEWLVGERPFQGSFSEIASQHLQASPPSLRKMNPHIPFEVEEVVMRTLAKDPNERFKRVAAFATALEQASAINTLVVKPTISASSDENKQLGLGREPSDSTFNDVKSAAPPVSAAASPSTSNDVLPVTLAEGMSTPIPSHLPEQIRSSSRFSRRTVVGGLIGIMGVAAIGGGFAWKRSQEPLIIYQGHSGTVYTATWSIDGVYIASGGADNTVQVWEVASGKLIGTNKHHMLSINALMWAPISGDRIVVASADKSVEIWKVQGGEVLVTYRGHTNMIRTVEWSADTKLIASGGDDTTVQIWSADTGKRLRTYTGHSALIWNVRWSSDGRYIASTSVDTTVQIWDATTTHTQRIYTGHSKPVKVADWSPDGTKIASGSDDATVQIWDVNSGKVLLIYHGHRGNVNTLAWSPDGTRIISGSDDTTVQIWDASTGKTIHLYDDQTNATVHMVLWAPNGKVFAVARQNIVQVWNAP